MSDRESKNYATMDIFRHTVPMDYMKILACFFIPFVFIHLLVGISIPDIVDDLWRQWLFIIELCLGMTLSVLYTIIILIPCIVARIADKESVIGYESEIMKIEDEEHVKTIDTQDKANIERLMKRTGMKYKEAKMAYMKKNFDDLQKRINTLALPPAADVVTRKWHCFKDENDKECSEIEIYGHRIHDDMYDETFNVRITADGVLVVNSGKSPHGSKVITYVENTKILEGEYRLFDTDGKQNVE